MRLWSIHPRYLDRIGLVALRRESLLARKVLAGEAKENVNHPRLNRFGRHVQTLKAVGDFPAAAREEALNRGYSLDTKKIRTCGSGDKIKLKRRQIEYEFELLLGRLEERTPQKYRALRVVKKEEIEADPLFDIIPGGIEQRERVID